MMQKLIFAGRYLKYFITSVNEHGLHSPFLFHFALNVIYLEYPFYAFKKLNKIREELLESKTTLTVEDYGAGSTVFKGNKRLVKDIAKHGITSKKNAELLFRIVNFAQPKISIELGTSLGLTSLYLAMAAKQSTLYTLEGSESLAHYSSQLFLKNEAKSICSINGKFEDTLPSLLAGLEKIDFVFIDGNHTKETTLNYFTLLIEKSHNETIMVFDDINWSEGMQEAWDIIRKNERVKISIDLFYMGILFFRKEQKEQEHFVIRF